MKTITVNSSAIHSISYDEKTQMMQIRFNSNIDKAYDYPNVPPEIITNFLAADSKGKYFHANMKQYAKK
jgi:hypothetical protein